MKAKTKERLLGCVGIWWLISGLIAAGDGFGREADMTRLVALASFAIASYVGYRIAESVAR